MNKTNYSFLGLEKVVEKLKEVKEAIKIKAKALSIKFLQKLRKLFSEKAFSKGQMIIFCIIIIWGSIIYTELPKFLMFVGGTLAG